MTDSNFLDELRRQAGVAPLAPRVVPVAPRVAFAPLPARVAVTTSAAPSLRQVAMAHASTNVELRRSTRHFLTGVVAAGAPLVGVNILLLQHVVELGANLGGRAVGEFGFSLVAFPGVYVQSVLIGLVCVAVAVCGMATRWFRSVSQSMSTVIHVLVWSAAAVYLPTLLVAGLAAVAYVLVAVLVVLVFGLVLWVVLMAAAS